MSSLPDGREVVIWHNPRCGKSREALGLIRERGIEPRIVEYLKTPPFRRELKEVITRLGLPPLRLLRSKEKPFMELGLGREGIAEGEILDAVAEHPILIERPIVLVGEKARIGRPPEAVCEVLPV